MFKLFVLMIVLGMAVLCCTKLEPVEWQEAGSLSSETEASSSDTEPVGLSSSEGGSSESQAENSSSSEADNSSSSAEPDNSSSSSSYMGGLSGTCEWDDQFNARLVYKTTKTALVHVQSGGLHIYVPNGITTTCGLKYLSIGDKDWDGYIPAWRADSAFIKDIKIRCTNNPAAEISCPDIKVQNPALENLTNIFDPYFVDSTDMQIYQVTIIDSKFWMAEDLNKNGKMLYAYNEANACPNGWRLPNEGDISTIQTITGLVAKDGWGDNKPDKGNYNTTYFSALPNSMEDQTKIFLIWLNNGNGNGNGGIRIFKIKFESNGYIGSTIPDSSYDSAGVRCVRNLHE